MNGAPDRGPAPRGLRWATLCVVAVALLSAGYAAWREDWTYDERIHVAWSQRFLDTGEVERLSVKRFNSKTTIQIANVLSGRLAQRLGVTDTTGLRFATRLPTLGWLLLLLGAVYAIVQTALGTVAAHLATLALAVDPNLIAHGSLATNDIAFVLAAWLTLGAAMAVAARPSLGRGVALGLALGLAFAAKFTAVLLVPAVALLPLAWSRLPFRDAWASLAMSLASAAATAYLVIVAAYLFRGLGAPLGDIPVRSGVMTRLAETFPDLGCPLPVGFVTGLDFALNFESPGPRAHEKVWNIVVLGRRFPKGCWFYFGLLWLLKTPVLVVLAMVAGWLAAARAGLLRAPVTRYLAANLAVWLVYLSFFFRAQIGYRLALLCLPPAAAVAAAGLALRPGPALGRLGVAVIVAALAEGAYYAGNPLSFTNAVVWPKRLVFRLISDSNVDWGQNRHRIKDWLVRARASDSHLDPLHMLPGHNTFSLNVLAGVFDFDQHRWLREHASPGGHFGHTYLWFRVDDDLYARFLADQRRLLPNVEAERRCSAAPMSREPPGTKLDFRLEGPLPPEEAWTVCVATARGAQFGLRAVEGHAIFGPLAASGGRTENVEQEQVAWYLLEPGMHAFSLRRIPNRRAWLPNVFAGRWLVRERAVSLAVIPGPTDASLAPGQEPATEAPLEAEPPPGAQ